MKKYMAGLLVILLLIVPVVAQDNDMSEDVHPLMSMMAFVPDTEVNREQWIAYADIRAAENARGIGLMVAPAVLGLMDFGEMIDTVPWVAAIGYMTSLPQFRDYLLVASEDMPEVMGFRVMDINRTLYLGELPGVGHVLEGNFNRGGMDAALTEREFELVEETENLAVWCWIEGCDEGLYTNVAERNLANIFGGQFGRREPTAWLDGFVLNSADNVVFRSMIGAYEGDVDLLMDDPAYATGLTLVTSEEGFLRQVFMIPAAWLVTVDVGAMLGERATGEVVAAFEEQMLADFVEIPAYELVVMADVATETDELAKIYLIYDNEADAEAMRERLQESFLETFSFRVQETWQDLLESQNAVFLPPEVVQDEDTGKFVTVLTFRNRIPPLEADGQLNWSSRTFRLFINGLMSRDLLWLATQLADED